MDQVQYITIPLYYIANKTETSAELLTFTVIEDKLRRVVDTLPFTVENIIAKVHENKLLVSSMEQITMNFILI